MDFRLLRVLCASSVLLAGCETVITLDIPISPPKLVVNCTFTQDTVWRVRVTESQHILDNAPIGEVTKATVQILENGTPIETLVHLGNGNYIGNTSPISGTPYEIRVTAAGYDDAISTDIAPQPIQIISLDTAKTNSGGHDYMRCGLKFSDDGTRSNYYMIQVFIDWWDYDYDQWGNIIDSFLYSDQLYFEANSAIIGGSGSFSGNRALFDDQLFQGKTITAPLLIDYNYFDPNGWKDFDRMRIRLSSVSESYYLYSTTLDASWQASGDPFAQPVQVYNNITGGYGVFAGFSVDEVEL